MSTPAKPIVPANTRRANADIAGGRDSVQVVPLRMFAAQITNERTGTKLYVGVEMANVFYAFPQGKDLPTLGNLADGFTPFTDNIQAQLRKHFDGTKTIEQGATAADVPGKDNVQVVG